MTIGNGRVREGVVGNGTVDENKYQEYLANKESKQETLHSVGMVAAVLVFIGLAALTF